MKKLIYISIVLLLFVSCTKDNEKVKVMYRVSNAYAETDVSYMDVDGQLIKENLVFDSGEDIWTYSMEQLHGEIIYLSAVYQDSASSVNLEILVDGKVYKQGSSNNEPQKYLTVSGTIPYN